ncbi:hypothetical protein ElyMa_006666200 [Elysia marginata]|uniref:Uncharacterized protein n=1 Tax=Elysia marginata TaxID=1093978 RepID=A0AAV4IPP6_9GAST|nr:hypothetical protein ElyMa_006666200 [Elysia marginata]
MVKFKGQSSSRVVVVAKVVVVPVVAAAAAVVVIVVVVSFVAVAAAILVATVTLQEHTERKACRHLTTHKSILPPLGIDRKGKYSITSTVWIFVSHLSV